jgi:hypothetical protein
LKCPWCGDGSELKILAEDHQREYEVDGSGYLTVADPYQTTFQFMKCGQCSNISLSQYDTDESADEERMQSENVCLWPKFSSLTVKDANLLPFHLYSMVLEFFECHAHGLWRSATFACRALLHMAILEAGGFKEQSFSVACGRAVTEGSVTQTEVDRLEAAFNVASKVVHDGDEVTEQDAKNMWVLTKAFLENHFWIKAREAEAKKERDRAANEADSHLKATHNKMVQARRASLGRAPRK